MPSSAPPDPMLLQPTSNLPPPSLDPREPAPPAITAPGGHIQTSRNRSTGTPRAPRTPTRSPARSAASSRATSPVLGLGIAKRGERGSFGAGAHPHGLQPVHLSAGSALTSGNSSGVNSTSSSRRDSGISGAQHGMGIITNSIDAALAGVKGNSTSNNPHLPTSPLSEASPPMSPLEGLAAGSTQPNSLAPRSRPLSGTTSPRARSTSQFASRSVHPSTDAAHSAFLRPVSPALSATASISDSMIFERDIESPLPPPVPSSVLDRRPSRRGSRASALNASAGQDHAAPAGHSLAHSQTHSHSNLHHHYTHGDFLESKIPTVLDDAVEALTALSESERQQQASGVSGIRTRLVDIEVESPVPVNWTSVGASVPGGRVSGTATPRHSSRPASPLRSGVRSPKTSHPTSPLLSAERPLLSTRTSSIGPMLPGAFPSGEEHQSDSWRRKIQDWIGPKGLDDEKPVSDLEKKDDREHKEKPRETDAAEKEVQQAAPVPQRTYLPSTLLPPSTEKHRISFVSYNDILTSHPLRVDPLQDITSGAVGEPDHLPGTVSPAIGVVGGRTLTPVQSGGVSRSVSLSRNGGTPAPGEGPVASSHGLSSSAIPTSIQDRLGISLNPVLPEQRAKGEWEKEGLGKGLTERLEELIADDHRR